MIQFTKGDMFAVPVDVRVNSVNCKGVMGAGVALAFKQLYPEMFKEYRRACRNGTIRPGALHVWKTLMGEWVINFPTKRDWRDPSCYEDICVGLEALRNYLQEQGPITVALPALGCGHGGLDWDRVSSMIEDKLGDLDARILVFAPADSREVGRVAQDQPSTEQIRALEKFGFRVLGLPWYEPALGVPSNILVKGDPNLLGTRWIALLPSKSPGERERAALQPVVRQMAQASDPVTIALVHATRATEDIAELFLEHGISIVLILPFGVLTRKKIAQIPTEGRRASFAIISVAAPEAAWSRQVLAQSMTLLRAGSSSVLISDPEPEWLAGRAAHAWAKRAIFFLRYESLPDNVCRILDDMGAHPISRRRNTGEPNLCPLFDAVRVFTRGNPKTDPGGG